jgi:BlaI family transcriptional regulator, penicillinase repressor
MQMDLSSYILTRQELEIMKVIWERGSATVKEVWDVISLTRVTAYTTTLTLMQILEKKGALARTKFGRTHIYKPLLSRQQATKNQVQDILSRFFDGNPQKMIEIVLEKRTERPNQTAIG